MGDKGKLIISTKAVAAGRKIYITVVALFVIALGVFALMTPEAFEDLRGRGTMGGFLYYALCAVMIGGGIFMIVGCFKGFKSYCDVYERGVVGTTGMSANKNAAPQQNFELAYSDIVNVTESGKTIYIYTNYGNFEVLALKNRVAVTQEIRKRMTGKKEGA